MSKLKIKLKTDIVEEIFPRKPLKSELRQLQVIENTIKLCSKNGFESLSYDQIAKACGVTRHLVIHYFPTKDDLVESAMEVVWASLKSFILLKLKEQNDPLDKMRAYLESNLEWSKVHKEFAIFYVMFLQYASCKPKFKKLNTELMQLGHERIQGLLEEGTQRKLFKKNFELQTLAKDIQITVLGQIISSLTDDYLSSETSSHFWIDSILKQITN